MAIGVWLLAVGVCDLLRATRDTTSWRRRFLLVALGVTLLIFAAVGLDLHATDWALVVPVWVLGLVSWVVGSSLALDPSTSVRGRWRAAAFASFAAPLAALALLGGAATTDARLPDLFTGSLLADVGPVRVLLVLGVIVFQLSTANLVVRLLLDAIGVPALANEKRLKGGRLLGPMERLFILVLGLAGELTAAAVVVAAKALLRFPELQRTASEEGPTDVSEYFLIGSFASWLLALGGLVLVRLG
ncbi:MAG: hypothetical protein M3393_08585 [Actinomycetota bacterium]|nr:hypothetical protein [Actinomycetota bacterium]